MEPSTAGREESAAQSQAGEPLRRAHERSYFRLMMLAAIAVSLLPFLYAHAISPPGARYLGHQFNVDDHMVYAAWMRQAMDGRFFFDNRFAVDAQPGLTVHLFFWVLGIGAKLLGVPLAATLARAFLIAVFVGLLGRLATRISPDVFTTKLTLTLALFGGGIGFLVWHDFGDALVRSGATWASPLTLGALPIDTWQPEAFAFPSMLTSSLFVVSLCLILYLMLCVLDAQTSWRPVAHGAVAMALLMNIHSYDVLLLALVLVGFLGMCVARRQATGVWAMRCAAIGAGAIPPALWFMHVLRNDPVFQARAATLTFSPNFRQILFGMLLLAAFAAVSLFRRKGASGAGMMAGAVAFGLLLVGLALFAKPATDAYWLSPVLFGCVLVAVYGVLFLIADERPAWNLVCAWALVGLVAPYFPALFQRKLAMGLAIPWGLLAGLGVAILVSHRERGARNLVTVLAIVVLCGSSLRWLLREVQLIGLNVASTTYHPVFLSPDAAGIVDALNEMEPTRRVVVAMPGVNLPARDESGRQIPDTFFQPYLPDLNPMLAGLTGVYAYAGHWSETPSYVERRNRATKLFLRGMSDEERKAFLEDIKADYLVAPVPATYPHLPLADLTGLGELIKDSPQFQLIKVTRERPSGAGG